MGKKSRGRWGRKDELPCCGAAESSASPPERTGVSAAAVREAEPGDAELAHADGLFAELMKAASRPRGDSSRRPSAAASRAAVAGGSACRKAPARAADGVCFPMMSAEEVAGISVPADASTEELRRVYQEHGVLLVTDVLSDEECQLMEALFLADLAQAVDSSKHMDAEAAEVMRRLQRQGLHAWPACWSEQLGRKGFALHRGLPQGWFAWAARLHPGVKRVFSALYSVPEEELAVGLDLPFWSAADDEPVDTNIEWLHVDQNHQTGMTWQCAQGVLYIWPSTDERSSCTVAWPGSHREEYARMMADGAAQSKGGRPAGQQVLLGRLHQADLREELLRRGRAGEAKRIPCPAGSLLLWDSRIIHQGWRGGPRLAQPVCWEPRDRRPADALRRKRHVCTTGLATSHSAAEGRIHSLLRSRQVGSAFSAGRPCFRDSIVPWPIAPECRARWAAMQHELWDPHGDPVSQARGVNAMEIRELLRSEADQAS